MEYLRQAWVYRFWIVFAVVLILPTVGYFVSTRGLAEEAAAKQAELEGLKKNLSSKASGSLPNQEWSQKVKELEGLLRKDVDGAWEALYNRQAALMTWPEDTGKIFGQPDIANVEVLPFQRSRFREAYKRQFEELKGSLKPTSMFGAQGLVDVPSEIVDKLQPTWINSTVPPSVEQIVLAQEDIWILKALFDVVNQSNEGSEGFRTSSVKRVVNLQIGEAGVAGDESATEDLVPPAGQAAAATKKTGGRYYPSKDQSLFKLVPVFVDLVVDQRDVVKVLSEFASCSIPMKISKVTFAAASERPGDQTTTTKRTTKTARTQTDEIGIPPAKEDEYFHMTQIKVWARAYMFEKPPSVVEAEKKAQQEQPNQDQNGQEQNGQNGQQ